MNRTTDESDLEAGFMAAIRPKVPSEPARRIKTMFAQDFADVFSREPGSYEKAKAAEGKMVEKLASMLAVIDDDAVAREAIEEILDLYHPEKRTVWPEPGRAASMSDIGDAMGQLLAPYKKERINFLTEVILALRKTLREATALLQGQARAAVSETIPQAESSE